MTGEELHQLRRRHQLTLVEFGEALGFDGNASTISRRVRRLEASDHVPVTVRLRARALTRSVDLPMRKA
jgi:hypothetical protein